MMLISVSLFIGAMTISASAATTNVSSYDALVSAIKNASDGDTINITSDITVSSPITVNKNIKLTSTETRYITCTVEKAFNITGGMLTVGGKLDISSTKTIIFLPNGGDFTLEDNAYIHASGTNYVTVKE